MHHYNVLFVAALGLQPPYEMVTVDYNIEAKDLHSFKESSHR